MAELDPRIPLMGSNPNFLATAGQAAQAAGTINNVKRQNALADLYQQQGPGILQGDQQAMNALAQFDPQAAMGIQQQRQQMGQADERLQMARAAAQREAEAHVSRMSAAERQRELEALDRGLAALSTAQTPERWDAIAKEIQPEFVGRFDDRDMLTAGALGIRGALEVSLARQGDTEADRELRRLESIGIPREMAIKIKEGVFRTSTDPLTRETTVIDLSTGQPVFNVGPGGTQGMGEPQGGPAQGLPGPQGQSSGPQTQLAPQGQPDAPVRGDNRGGLTYGDQYQATDQSFGVEGLIRRGINTATDMAGMGPAYPDVESTQADFRLLRENLLNDIASGYGRQPPSWLMQEIRSLTPGAGTGQGAGRAESQLRAIGRSFTQEIEKTRKQLEHRLSPSDRAQYSARLADLENAKNRVDTALFSFSRPQLAPEDEALIQKYLED